MDEIASIMGAARRGRPFYRGQAIAPHFATSAPFLAAWARYERANAAYWQHEVAYDPDHDAGLRDDSDRAADTASP